MAVRNGGLLVQPVNAYKLHRPPDFLLTSGPKKCGLVNQLVVYWVLTSIFEAHVERHDILNVGRVDILSHKMEATSRHDCNC